MIYHLLGLPVVDVAVRILLHVEWVEAVLFAGGHEFGDYFWFCEAGPHYFYSAGLWWPVWFLMLAMVFMLVLVLSFFIT